jgi:hypothetical protein
MVPAKRSPVDQISGQHDPQIIPASLPGAGNLLLFDDRGEAGYPPAKLNVVTRGSRVLEIDPAQKQIWEYKRSDIDPTEWAFYSSFISDVRRLPNGNTFIDGRMTGASSR